MLDGIANGHTKSKEQNLGDGEEGGAEYYVADGPTILERAEYEDELRDDIDYGTYERPEDVHDPESDGLAKTESGDLLKGCDGEEELEAKNGKARDTEELESF